MHVLEKIIEHMYKSVYSLTFSKVVCVCMMYSIIHVSNGWRNLRRVALAKWPRGSLGLPRCYPAQTAAATKTRCNVMLGAFEIFWVVVLFSGFPKIHWRAMGVGGGVPKSGRKCNKKLALATAMACTSDSQEKEACTVYRAWC